MKRGGPLSRHTPLPRTPFAGGAPLVRARTPKWGKSKRKTEAGRELGRLYPSAAARAGGACERCAAYTDLVLHHRKLRSQGGPERLSNYLMLCPPCHTSGDDAVHAKPNWAMVQGWLLQSHQLPEASPVLYRGRMVLLDDEGGVS